MPQYTAAQLRNAWKPVMRRLGFQLDHSCFVKRNDPIKQLVVFDRSQESRDVLVKLFVCVIDPFEPDETLKDRVCLSAYLHRDGAQFRSTHWNENELAGAAAVFEQFGSPFFEQFRSIGKLITILEAAQAAFQSPEAYLRGAVSEPTDPISREFISSLPIRAPGPIPANEELLALLYWHSGDATRAVEHALRCLELSPEDPRINSRLTTMVRPLA